MNDYGLPHHQQQDSSAAPLPRRGFLQGAAAGAMLLSGCASLTATSATSAMPENPLPDLLPGQSLHPTRLPLSGWLDWQDPRSGNTWRIWVQMPDSAPPPEGYPALLIMDGNAIFPLAAQWARLQQTRPAYVRGVPSVIIGIGHPVNALFEADSRKRDFTPPAPGAQAGEGGADALLDFLQHVLLADWIKRIPLDPGRLGLFGHSLSGLFVLHALFTRPTLFSEYHAASPSIWWNGAFLLQEQEAFTQRHASRYALPADAAQALHANVFLYAGSLEEPSGEARPAGAPPTGQRHTVRLQITRAREMAEQLQALQWPNLSAGFTLWPGLTHGDTMMPSLMQAVGNISKPSAWKDADYGLREPSR